MKNVFLPTRSLQTSKESGLQQETIELVDQRLVTDFFPFCAPYFDGFAVFDGFPSTTIRDGNFFGAPYSFPDGNLDFLGVAAVVMR